MKYGWYEEDLKANDIVRYTYILDRSKEEKRNNTVEIMMSRVNCMDNYERTSETTNLSKRTFICSDFYRGAVQIAFIKCTPETIGKFAHILYREVVPFLEQAGHDV